MSLDHYPESARAAIQNIIQRGPSETQQAKDIDEAFDRAIKKMHEDETVERLDGFMVEITYRGNLIDMQHKAPVSYMYAIFSFHQAVEDHPECRVVLWRDDEVLFIYPGK